MKRRTFCRAASALSIAAALSTRAQPGGPYRVGWVTIERAGTASPSQDAFRLGMRELGYTIPQSVLVRPEVIE